METTTITHNRPEADADNSGLANGSVSLLARHRSVIQVYLVAQVCQMLKVLVHEGGKV
jgi:hypothetical protein